MIYGQEFNKYYQDSIEFWVGEQRKEAWITSAVLVQTLLVLLGLLFIPAAFMTTWLTAVAVGLIITLCELIVVWRNQRKYSSFENWKKHVRDRD